MLAAEIAPSVGAGYKALLDRYQSQWAHSPQPGGARCMVHCAGSRIHSRHSAHSVGVSRDQQHAQSLSCKYRTRVLPEDLGSVLADVSLSLFASLQKFSDRACMSVAS